MDVFIVFMFFFSNTNNNFLGHHPELFGIDRLVVRQNKLNMTCEQISGTPGYACPQWGEPRQCRQCPSQTRAA
jgi:hypothetical protein